MLGHGAIAEFALCEVEGAPPIVVGGYPHSFGVIFLVVIHIALGLCYND
jgi:hypothetical protein